MTEIRLDLDLTHPPVRVWRAVTDRRELSEWFMRAQADPAGPGRLRFEPAGADGLAGPVRAEVVEAEPPSRLVMRWYAEDLHVRVNITIEPTPGGCRLTFVQRGFLGPNGTLRRRVLRGTYGRLLGERLPAYLDRAPVPVDGGAKRNDGGFRSLRVPEPAAATRMGRAYGDTPAAPPESPPAEPASVGGQVAVPEAGPVVVDVAGSAAEPGAGPAGGLTSGVAHVPRLPLRPRDRLWLLRRHRVHRRLGGAPDAAPAHLIVREAGAWLRAIPGWTAERRSRAVAVGAVLLLLIALVMVVVARVTVDSLAGPPQVGGGDDRLPGFTVVPGEPGASGGTAATGGASAGADRSAAAGGAPATVVAASPLTGAYHTASTWVGGYRGEVRITNPAVGPVRGWTAVITLPLLGLVVQDVHGAQFRQSGKTVTFKPIDATGTVAPGASVSFDFAVNGVGAPTGCTVDGHPCGGLPG